MMQLKIFKDLIENLPVKRHSVYLRYSNLSSNLNKKLQAKIKKEIFNNKEEIIISRHDIFHENDLTKKIYKTILWGYPRGMRNNNHILLFNNIKKIKTLLTNNKNITDWENHIKNIKIKGLGLSTYSKLLYFTKIKINNKNALILDNKIINCIRKNKFTDFQKIQNITYTQANISFYPNYLSIISDVAKKLKVKEKDKIEFFLFLFGNTI